MIWWSRDDLKFKFEFRDHPQSELILLKIDGPEENGLFLDSKWPYFWKWAAQNDVVNFKFKFDHFIKMGWVWVDLGVVSFGNRIGNELQN